MSAPTPWPVRILFASALVLAFVGGEWHGRRSAESSDGYAPAWVRVEFTGHERGWIGFRADAMGKHGAGSADIYTTNLTGDLCVKPPKDTSPTAPSGIRFFGKETHPTKAWGHVSAFDVGVYPKPPVDPGCQVGIPRGASGILDWVPCP
jgi:hypothetical protein